MHFHCYFALYLSQYINHIYLLISFILHTSILDNYFHFVLVQFSLTYFRHLNWHNKITLNILLNVSLDKSCPSRHQNTKVSWLFKCYFLFTSVFPSATHYSAESTEAMQIVSCWRFETSTSESRNRRLIHMTNTPKFGVDVPKLMTWHTSAFMKWLQLLVLHLL